MRLRDELDELQALIAAVSLRRDIPAVHVEKDFWLTEALRGMARYAESEQFTLLFKGGTSLSKAFGIIERFSEDVDVLVVLPGEWGKAKRDSRLKALVKAAETATGLVSAVVPGGTSTGIKRAARLNYQNASSDLGGLSSGVLLEIGSRGGVLPFHTREVQSIVVEHAPQDLHGYEETEPFSVAVLSPARTLVEKLVLLHTVHASGNPDEVARTSRHYYDLHRLLNRAEVCTELRTLHTDAVARDVCTYSQVAELPAAPRPNGGFASSPAFRLDGPHRAGAQAAYDRVIGQLVWPRAARPSFVDCIAAVQASREFL